MTAFPTPSTPFPNALLDHVMPTLRDTEWRLLCVVVRQTLGWSSGGNGRRKQRDWLSHRQLTRRTGRASGAISKAIDALVRSAYIEVTDEEGCQLLSPAERRRSNARLHYRLGPRLWSQIDPAPPVTADSMAQPAMPIAETPKHKATTTKPTYYKREPIGCADDVEKPVDNPAETPRLPQSEPDVRRALATYRALFMERSTRHEPPPIHWGRDGKRIRALLALYGSDRVVELLEAFFRCDDEWIRRSGYSLGAFEAAVPRMLMRLP